MFQLPYASEAHAYDFNEKTIQLYVPDAQQLQVTHLQGSELAKPYWGKVWPAALGLCRYLAQHSQLVAGKEVMELAAGLGLPSLLAAQWAHNVWCTDISPEAARFQYASAQLNQLENVTATVLDWNDLEPEMVPDVMLLSDINYEPEVFATLEALLRNVLVRGTTVLLSTPHRLMAKPFIEGLLPWCRQQESTTIVEAGVETGVSIYFLRK